MVRFTAATLLLLSLGAGCFAATDETAPPPVEKPDPEPAAPHWQEVVKTRLQKRITLALDESTLSDALANFRQMATVAIFTDPTITDDEQGDINQNFNDMPLADALPRLLGPLGLEYTIRDEAIFVYRRNAYSADASSSGTLPDRKLSELKSAIVELASDDFRVREHGSETLAKFGNAAAPYLLKAIRASTDPEAQQRMKRLAERYAAKPFPEPAPDAAQKLDTLTALLATDFESTRVGEAAQFIAVNVGKKTGTQPAIDVAAELRDQTVYMPPAVMHAGNMLKWLAVLSGAQITLEGEKLKFSKR